MFKLTRWAAALSLTAGAACADPGYYVVTPYDNAGLRSIDLRYWTVKPRGGVEVLWPEIGFAYGINSRWTTELFLSYIGSSADAMVPSTLNWQNDILLTQGEWPFDIAVHTQWIDDRRRSGQYAIEYGLVFQTDIERTQINANLIFERGFNAPQPKPAQLKYQWQLRHRWTRTLHLGMQGFGEVGDWDAWAAHARQSHRAGPALFTTLRLGEREALHFQAAYLLGRTYGRQGHMFTLRTHYDF